MRLAVLAAAAVFFAAPARAADAPLEPSERADAPKREFYGWQNIVVGYTGQLLMVHGFFSDSPAILGVGAVTYTFGGAVIHGVHGNSGAAIASPFILTGAPLAVALIIASARADEAFAIPAIYLLLAPVLDGVLGYAPARERVAVFPSVRRDSLGLSLTGAF